VNGIAQLNASERLTLDFARSMTSAAEQESELAGLSCRSGRPGGL